MVNVDGGGTAVHVRACSCRGISTGDGGGTVVYAGTAVNVTVRSRRRIGAGN